MAVDSTNRKDNSDIQDLLKKAKKQWNSDKKRWEMDMGYIAAVHRRDGSHESRRYQNSDGDWSPRGNNTEANSYIPDFQPYPRELPAWVMKTDGSVENYDFLKRWKSSDDLDELHRELFWMTEDEIVRKMRALKRYLKSKNLGSPAILKDPKKMLSHREIVSLLNNNVLVPLDGSGNPKTGEYKQQSDGTYKFIEN